MSTLFRRRAAHAEIVLTRGTEVTLWAQITLS